MRRLRQCPGRAHGLKEAGVGFGWQGRGFCVMYSHGVTHLSHGGQVVWDFFFLLFCNFLKFHFALFSLVELFCFH